MARFLGLTVLLLLLTASTAHASNSRFLDGDAYFATFVPAEPDPDDKHPLRFSYFLRKDRLMKCGYHGIPELSLSDGGEQIEALISWARDRPWTEQKHDWGAERGFYLVFVPKGYDPSKYGFFLRYNETASRHKSHGKLPPMGGGVHVDDKQLARRSRKLARRVRRLPLVKTTEDDVTLAALDRVDVYVLDNAAREDYARGKAGLAAWRLRDGALERLHHDGKRWRRVGPAEGWLTPDIPFRK